MAKVHFILGCTACGKGAVGRELARRVGGQIVSVDSMKIYRRMDVGTAKPSAPVRAQVTHHCIDVVEPSESFSVAQFVAHADRAVGAIDAAGDAALAVGGTSLYIKALSEGLFDGPPADEDLRAELRSRAREEGLAALHHPNDERRIVRALEVYRKTGTRISELQEQWDRGERRYDCTFIGLRREKRDQNRRINARVRRMAAMGLRDEVAGLLAEPAGLSDQAAQAVGYAEMIDHLRGRCSLEEAVERIKVNTRRLAKKQRTWHRRFREVTWFDLSPEETAGNAVARILQRVRFGGTSGRDAGDGIR